MQAHAAAASKVRELPPADIEAIPEKVLKEVMVQHHVPRHPQIPQLPHDVQVPEAAAAVSHASHAPQALLEKVREEVTVQHHLPWHPQVPQDSGHVHQKPNLLQPARVLEAPSSSTSIQFMPQTQLMTTPTTTAPAGKGLPHKEPGLTWALGSTKPSSSTAAPDTSINLSDDECQVVEAKIKLLKRCKPSSGFKDFQYEVPGLHNKMRKKDSEIINLASSDEEVDPVKNGSRDTLPLPVPINNLPMVPNPPAHIKQHITTAATHDEEIEPVRNGSSEPLPLPVPINKGPKVQLPPAHLTQLGNMELLIDLLEQMSRINSEFFHLFLKPKDEHCYVPTAHHKDWPRILTWSQMRTTYEQGYNYLSEVTKNEGYSKDYGFPHPSVFPSTRTSTAIKSSL